MTKRDTEPRSVIVPETLTASPEPNIPQDPSLLFNVREDLSENFNIAAAHPEFVAELTRAFEQAKKTSQIGNAFKERLSF